MAPSSMKRPFSSLLATVRRLVEDVFGGTESADGEEVAGVTNSPLPAECDRILVEDEGRAFRFFPFIFCLIWLEYYRVHEM